MKPFILSLFAISVLTFAGCSKTQSASSGKDDSETVMVTYHVQPGKETEFEQVLARAWEVYRSEHMVAAQPHVVVRDAEEGGKTNFVEIFTWTNSPDHPPKSVMAVWKQEQVLCEPRDGHTGIVGGEVALVAGKL